MEKEVNRKWVLVAVIVTLIWGGLLGYFVGGVPKQEPEVILWSNQYFDSDPKVSAEIGEVHRRLREVLPDVNFHETPFREAVKQLENSVREASPQLRPVIFRIEKEVPLDTPINLKFTEVPVSEALRYVSSMNSCRDEVQAGGVIRMDSLHSTLVPAPIEGRFAVPPEFFHGIDLTKDPDAVRKSFENGGVTFSPSDSVEYFPDRSLLRASTMPRKS